MQCFLCTLQSVDMALRSAQHLQVTPPSSQALQWGCQRVHGVVGRMRTCGRRTWRWRSGCCCARARPGWPARPRCCCPSRGARLRSRRALRHLLCTVRCVLFLKWGVRF